MGELWLSKADQNFQMDCMFFKTGFGVAPTFSHFRIDAQKVGLEKREFNSKRGKEVMVKYVVKNKIMLICVHMNVMLLQSGSKLIEGEG